MNEVKAVPYLNFFRPISELETPWGSGKRRMGAHDAWDLIIFRKKRSSFMYKCFFRIFATTIKFLDMPFLGNCSNNLFETSLLSTRNVTDMAKL